MADNEFRWEGGRPALDFVATLGRRHAEPVERLPDGRAAAHWLTLAGLLPGADVGPRELNRMRELREAINRVLRAELAHRKADGSDIRAINEAASRPDLAPRLVAGSAGLHTKTAGDKVSAALSTLARDAIALIEAVKAGRVRECASPHCSLLFYDASQGGRRRWCSMEKCGNVAKVRTYRSHRVKGPTE